MMSRATSVDPADLFFQHLAAIREYVEQVFVEGDTLSTQQEADRTTLMLEFFDVGSLCEFTQKQLVTLVYAELLNV
ncbi:MAG: hypothetical protein IIC84_08775 [Chloroflexi bacterium]|nr:hypothetical protein [Chloroflexota bacterium]